MNRPVLVLLVVVVVIAVIALIGCCCCVAVGGVLFWEISYSSRVQTVKVATVTARPRPTNTARVIPTPRPTSTPRPTLTPRPTNTPRPTATSRPTDTPRPTPKPAPTVTRTPVVSRVYMEDDGKGHQRCEPDTVKAGRIVIERGVGRWPTKEEAYAALGDSWPPIVANGRELPTKHLERSQVQWHGTGPDDPNPGWGFHAKVEVWLDPGVYEITSQWLHDLKTGTLTVVAP